MTDRYVRYIGDDEQFAVAVADALDETTESDWKASVDTDSTLVDDGTEHACLVVEDAPPSTDAIALAERLRGDGRTLPIVVLGTAVDEERHARVLETGATDYLPKSTATPELVASRLRDAGSTDPTDGRRPNWQPENVLQRVTDSFFALDENWEFTYVNESAQELLGRSETDLLGNNIWEEFPAAVDSPFQRHYERAMASGESTTFEARYPPLDAWFEVHAYPDSAGLSVYFQNVNDRKERERELERYETIIESVGDGVYVLDDDSRFVMVNDAYCELTGWDRDELLGAHSRKVTGDTTFEAVSQVQQTLEAGETGSTTFETELPTRNGANVPIRATISLFPFEDEFGRVGTVRDITAEKRFESTLAALHETTRQLLGDESRTAVAERVRETMVDVIGLPGVAVYLADDDDVLQPSAHSEYLDDVFGDLGQYEFEPGTTSITRQAYDSGETITFDDVRETDLAYTSATPLRSGIWIPLGEHGMIGIVSEAIAAFDDDDQRLAELLAASAEFALDRLERDQQRRSRRQQLEHLNDVSRDLVGAKTREEVCQRAVEAARETLALPVTVIEQYNEDEGRLYPTARTDAVDGIDGDAALFQGDSDPVWDAYVNDTNRVYDDVLRETDIDPEDSAIRSAIILPLGEHGVLISGATEPNVFTEDDVAPAEILAANTQAVLDRVAREETLYERTASLEEKTASLQRVNRVNDLIRTITQSLIQATTRAEIDRAVVEQLVQAAPYEFVWIGDRSVGQETIDVRASAGDDELAVDAMRSASSDPDSDPSPSMSVVETGDSRFEPSIHATPPMATWRQEALAAGLGSAIAVPLRYRNSTYGVLTVYTDEQDEVTELEQTVLEELGEMVGYAINAIERKKALVSEQTVELAFTVADTSIPALEFVRETKATFTFEMLLSASDGSLRVFFTVDGVDPETVVEFADRATAVESVSHVAEQAEGHLFEAVASNDGFLGSLLQYGAQVQELTADADDARIVVTLPKDGTVNTFIDMFVSTYEDAELVARREREQDPIADKQFFTAYRDRLTERQEEVLETAHLSGFFEWPREITGQEVAEMLDVSQPTVNRHIRKAERKLFDLVFDEE